MTDDELLALARSMDDDESFLVSRKVVIAMIERHRADADAGREFMRAAWQEFNAIRARDGAPSGVSEAWWSELTDALDKLLGNDTVPWMLGAAKELVSPYATRAEKAEAEVERLTRERDEARSWNSLYNREPHEAKKKAIALRAANWEHGCACQFDEDDEQILWCSPHAELKQRAEAAESALAAVTRERDEARRESEHWQDMADHGEAVLAVVTREMDAFVGLADERRQRAEQAESALAAAQKRVGELQGTVAFFASVIKSGEPWTQTCEDALRAALNESGNGDETVRPDQQVKDG